MSKHLELSEKDLDSVVKEALEGGGTERGIVETNERKKCNHMLSLVKQAIYFDEGE